MILGYTYQLTKKAETLNIFQLQNWIDKGSLVK